MTDSDDKVILTPDEAIALLPEGEYVHNFANPGVGMLVGCDYERDNAIKHIRSAYQIELAGEQCMRLKHPLAVWDSKTHVTFFAADMAKVQAFEASRTANGSAP